MLHADSVAFFKRFSRFDLVNFDARYFEIKLGKVPKDLEGWWNHNLVYIHNKQLCHFVFLSNYPGELNLELIDVPYYPPVPVDDYTFDIEHFADTVELFYAPNEMSSKGNGLKELIEKYKEKQVTITSCEIKGFSSVEGKTAVNEVLHAKRAENILNSLQVIMANNNLYSIDSEVAWSHFYAAVAEDPKWKFFASMSRDEIQAYFADGVNERPTKILEQERKVVITLEGTRRFNKTTAMYYINRDLVQLFQKNSQRKLACIDPVKLEKLYEKAYFLYTKDSISKEEFLSIKIPKYEGTFPHSLEEDMYFYSYHILKESASPQELSTLESKMESLFDRCGDPKHLTPEFHYLTAVKLVEEIEKIKVKNQTNDFKIQKAFDRLSNLLTSYSLDSVFVYDVAKANLNIINMLCLNIGQDQIYEHSETINTSLIHIIQYYRRTNQLTPETVLTLSNLLCYFNNVGLAVQLCEDFLYDDAVLKLYLPLAYVHSSYLSPVEELMFEAYFHDLLMKAKVRLTNAEWCALFYGENGIPFQVMDNENLHNEFCETCPDRVNDVFKESR